MKELTNELGLPWPVVSAIRNHRYTKGKADYSATELLKPPRVRELQRIHDDEIEEDASEFVFALLGTVAHFILELGVYYDIWDVVNDLLQLHYEEGRGTRKTFIKKVNILWKLLVGHYKADRNGKAVVERRLFWTCPSTGKTISGAIDLVYPDRVITDYKMMSVYEGIHGLKQEKIQQLNIYNLLACEGVTSDGHPSDLDPPRQLQICSLYRDWSKTKANLARLKGDSYPQRQVAVFKLNKWELNETKEFIAGRIRKHMAAEQELPQCSANDRWARPPKFAVRKRGRKSALRVLDSYNDALEWMEKNEKGESVEERPGQSIRCELYCNVSGFCSQWDEIRAYMEAATK